MERRTQPGYEYHSCDFMDDGVYIDMNLLREYEDTGLIPEQIRELKERDEAKSPVEITAHPSYIKHFACPRCRSEVHNIFRFCPICSQRLKKGD